MNMNNFPRGFESATERRPLPRWVMWLAAALDYIENNSIVSVGTGSTVNHFIDGLASVRARIRGAVSSSSRTRSARSSRSWWPR